MLAADHTDSLHTLLNLNMHKIMSRNLTYTVPNDGSDLPDRHQSLFNRQFTGGGFAFLAAVYTLNHMLLETVPRKATSIRKAAAYFPVLVQSEENLVHACHSIS